MAEPLTDHEIRQLRGLLKGTGLDDPYMVGEQAEGLGLSLRDLGLNLYNTESIRRLSGFASGLKGSTTSPAHAEQIGARMNELMGMSYHSAALVSMSGYAAQLLDLARLVGPCAKRLADLANETAPESTIREGVQREIGALKAELGQAVEAINASMATVQTVVDALREEHELVAVSRHLEQDPEWGKFA